MNPAYFTRRLMLLLGASTLALGACSDRPADATASGFSGIDITGADYATGFSLTDHNGQPRTLADFKGKAVVVFFGFTQCPDVCPTSLGELAQARQLLGADGERLQGLFISVDPERDTPEVMQAYMASFDPSFLALYSAPDALPELAKSYKVYYKKVEGKPPPSSPMDHSAGSSVYDPQGRIRRYPRYGSGAKALADDVKKLLDEAGN
jgi:protein SCO1/2